MILVRLDTVGNQFRTFLDNYDSRIGRSAQLAINRGARRGRTLGSREIRKQVNLKAGYVNERLKVTRFASKNQLEAVIEGRQRATQLIQFSSKQKTRTRAGRRKGAGVSVKVKAGGARKTIKQAFFVNLLNNNTGIAVRIDGGNRFRVLYGPSVQQVFFTVAKDISPTVADIVADEFTRQLERLSG